ncbi:MAG TPA: hypothetical protein VK575_08880, partial [Gemmatimonadaceae bacterium]|nr:hypothetical protein [Gemmatimonadaceae bacterium]
LSIYGAVQIEVSNGRRSRGFDRFEWWNQVRTAASVTFFRPEFDDFLYAPIGADRNQMTVTVLSALSRLDVDAWEEAAELSELPTDTATQRLASLIARLPGGSWAQADPTEIADRLIELLPRRSKSNVRSAEKAGGIRELSVSTVVQICAALLLAAILITSNLERSTQRDDPYAAAPSTGPLPQALPQ